MTTVLADGHLGVMVSESNCTDGDRTWAVKKVHRVQGHLIGLAGTMADFPAFLAWFKGGMVGPTPRFKGSTALVMAPNGRLFQYTGDEGVYLPLASRREAIGSGAKAAMAAYEALDWTDPQRAMRIVCKHDAGSRLPVRTYKLGST